MPQLDAYNLINWACSSIVSTLYSYFFFVLVFLRAYLVNFRMRLAKFNLLVWSWIYVLFEFVRIYRKSLFKKRKIFFKFNRKKFLKLRFLRRRKKTRGKTLRSSLYFLFILNALKTTIMPGRVRLFKAIKSLLIKKPKYVFSL